MTNEIKKLTIILVIIFCIAGNAFAGDGKSLTVSCVIPAIPGISAAIVSDGKGTQKDGQDKASQQAEIKDKIVPTETASANNNAKNIFFLSEAKTDTGLMQTVYIR